MNLETIKNNCEKAVGASYLKRKNAVRDLDALIQENPDSGELYYWKGYYHILMDLVSVGWQNIVNWFDTALKHGYETPDVHYWKSVVLALAGQDLHALDCLDKALEMEPHHATALYGKGRILMGNQLHDDALACFAKITQKNETVYNQMGEIYLDKSMDDKAEECLNKAIETRGTTQTSNTEQLLERIQRRRKYRAKTATYNKGIAKELDHLKPDQWFPKPIRRGLIAWADQTRHTASGINANVERLHNKIKERPDSWNGGSGFFLQTELTRKLWTSHNFTVTDVERSYKTGKTRNIDIDIELDGKFSVQVWSGIGTEGLITMGEFDGGSRQKNLQNGLTTRLGGLGGDADRDWIGLESKLNQLPDDKPGFVVAGYPIWPPSHRYRIEPKYCQGIPPNKCVIVLDIDLSRSSLSGRSILYCHPNCSCVDIAKTISRDVGFEPCARNPPFPQM